jgi:protein required for attachment to host cells
MHTDKKIWIVLADSAQARFLTPADRLQHLVPARPELRSESVHRSTRDLLGGAAGRVAGDATTGLRHAVEPPHDPHKLEKHKFVVALAGVLDEACRDKAFDKIVLTAPPRTLGELRGVLSTAVKTRIAGELGKDLTKTPVGDLWPHIGALVERVASGLAE